MFPDTGRHVEGLRTLGVGVLHLDDTHAFNFENIVLEQILSLAPRNRLLKGGSLKSNGRIGLFLLTGIQL